MEIANTSSGKKWLLGIDGSRSPIEVGYFEKAQDSLHYHEKIYEYFLVFSGELNLLVNEAENILKSGDICCIEPGEKHMVIKTSDDLKCFLIKYPHLPEDKIIAEEK